MNRPVRWVGPHRARGAGGAVATVAIYLLVAAICGLAIPLLPLQLSMGFGMLAVGVTALLVTAVAPQMTQIPHRALAWGLVIALVFYFVWPRNVFLPVRGLPVKHPQRLFYLLFLAYAAYVVLKCHPARQRLAQGLRAMPWFTGLWLALAMWQLLSLVFSEHSLALIGPWFVDFLVVTLVYPLVLLCLATPQDYRRLMIGLLLAALFNCLLAIPESVLQRNLFESFIALESLDPVMAQQIIAAKVRGGAYRAQAAFDHPLLFAEFLVVNVPVAIALLLERGRRTLGACALVLLAIGLALSHSRIALVASALAIAVIVVVLILRGAQVGRRNPWPLVAAVFAVPVAVLALALGTDFVAQVAVGRTAVEASSSSVRLIQLVEGWRRVQEQPLLGFGPATAGFVLNFQNTFGVRTLDNYLLSLALDSGIPALALFVLAIVALGWRSAGIAIVSHHNQCQNIAMTVVAGLVAFVAIKGVLGTPLNNLLLPMWAATIAILINTLGRGKSNRPRSDLV